MKVTWDNLSIPYRFSFSSLLMQSPLTQLPRLSPPQKRVNFKTVITPDGDDPEATILELDELWSFVLKKANRRGSGSHCVAKRVKSYPMR